MIPIGDYAGARPRFPYVNIALILISIAVFIYELTLGNNLDNFFLTWGAIPKELTTGADSAPLLPNNLPVYVTLVSSIFIHGSWLHLIGNMVFLWASVTTSRTPSGPVRSSSSTSSAASPPPGCRSPPARDRCRQPSGRAARLPG